MEDHRHQGIPQQHDDAAKDEYPDDGQDHEADYFANPKPNPAANKLSVHILHF